MPENKSAENAFINSYRHIIVWLISALLFFAPLFPDIKLTRPKLLLLETGIYGILFLFLIFSFLGRNIRIRLSPLAVPALFYAGANAAFYFFSPDRHVALNELKRSFLSISAFLLISNAVISDRQRNTAIFSWLLGTFFAFIYGILQYSGGAWFLSVPKMNRVMSTFGNPIFFGAHIVLTLPIALGFFFYTKKYILRIFLSLFFAAGLAALYLSKTRASFIGFAVSMVLFLALAVNRKKLKYILISLFIILSLAFTYSSRNIWQRHQEHFLIWRDTLVMCSKHPFFGTGPGTFHIYFPKFASQELKDIWPQKQFVVNDAHNEYLQHLSETGIAGFGIFLWLLFSFFAYSAKIRRSASGPDRLLISGLICASSGILIQNLFSVDMRFIVSSVYLFMLMGLTDSFSDRYYEKKNISPAVKFAGIIICALVSVFTFQKVLKPYIAYKVYSKTPDFFDEKVLEPARSIADLRKLAEKYPDKASIYEKMGWIYAKEKNWKEAVENYLTAHRLNPEIAGPLNNLGNIFFLTGDRNRAIEYWNRSLKINPSQVDSRLNLATAYYYNGQLKQAADHLKVVLKLDPGNKKALVMLKQMVE
jgi:O-antigen ligase